MTPVNQANQALESKINTTQDMIKFMGDAKALGDKNEEAAQVLQTQVSRLSKDDVDSGISDAISVEAEAGASLYRIHSQRWRLISEYGAAFSDPFDSGRAEKLERLPKEISAITEKVPEATARLVAARKRFAQLAQPYQRAASNTAADKGCKALIRVMIAMLKVVRRFDRKTTKRL